MGNAAQENEKSIKGLIKVDEDEFKDHPDALVRQSVEKTVNSLPTRKTHSCPDFRYL